MSTSPSPQSKDGKSWRNKLRNLLLVLAIFYTIQWGLGTYLAHANADKFESIMSLMPEGPLKEVTGRSSSPYERIVGNGWHVSMAALASLDPTLLRAIDQSATFDDTHWSVLNQSLDRAHTFLELAKSCQRQFPELSWEQGYAMPMPHLAPIRNYVKAVCASANHAYQKGERNSGRLLDAVRMIRLGVGEPVLISHLVQLACLGLVLDSLDSCGPLEPTEARALLAELEGYDLEEQRRLANIGEVFFGLSYWKQLQGGDVSPLEVLEAINAPLPQFFSIQFYRLIPLLPLWVEWDKRAYLDIMHDSIEGGNVDEGSIPTVCILTRLIVPSLGNSKAQTMAMAAKLESARAKLRVMAGN
ncbi:MAG: hypothetical protein AB7F75_08780 [Planctomycetota bacterium]